MIRIFISCACVCPYPLKITEWRYQKFSKTETETFFPRPNSPKLKPILFFRDQIFRNQNWDFFSENKFSDTETLQKLAKDSRPKPRPRLFNILDNFWQIFFNYFPPFFSVFLFQKIIFFFSKYFPPITSPPESNVNVNVNVAVFAFLHLIDKKKTKKD